MIIYLVLSFLFAPLYLIALLWCGNLGVLRYRLGRLPVSPPAATRVYWLHAASLGEVTSIKSIIESLIINYPDAQILITTSTVAGYGAAQKTYPHTTHGYLPLDTPLCLYWAFKRVRPTHLFITEAERWPGLFWFAQMFSTRLIGLNSYIKPASVESPLQKVLYKKMYSYYDDIFTQAPPMFSCLDLPHTTIHQCCSFKAGGVLPVKKVRQRTLPVLMVGSVYQDELENYTNLWRALYAQGTECHMILIPRHLSWRHELEKQTNKLPGTITHFNTSAGSTPNDLLVHLKSELKKPGITTISMIGIMKDVYKLSSIFYLGGTFNDIGGHNVLEPAGWTLPIVSGPNLAATNYEAHAMHKTGGLRTTAHGRELATLTEKLLASPHLREEMGKKNAAWVKAQAASIKKSLALISSF